MARLPLIKQEALDEAGKELFSRMAKSRGSPGHIWQVLLNAPDVASHVLGMADALRHQTKLSRKFRELAVVMVGIVTACEYEYEHHRVAAINAGVSLEQLNTLRSFRSSPHFDENERSILQFAVESTEFGSVKA